MSKSTLPESSRICEAVLEGNVVMVRSLLDSEPGLVNQRSLGGELPIHLAVRVGNTAILQLLLDHGADVNARDGFGATPLHHAAEQSDVRCAVILIAAKADLEAFDYGNERPLHHAVQQDNRDLILMLLDHGAEINARGQFERTPLQYAAVDARPVSAEILISRGADLEARDIHGHTALFLCLGHIPPRSSTILGLLLQGGANLTIHVAIRLGMTHIVRCLLKDDPGLIRTEPDSKDFLTSAVRTKDKKLVEMLIAFGVDVNTSKYEPLPLMTALECFARNDYMDFVHLLLNHGADPNRKQCPDQISPLEWARMNDQALLELFSRK